MSERVCRWGILGTATIAHKNWLAIRNAENATVTAVASRNQQRAEEFINECQAEAPIQTPVHAYGSYEQLLADPNVDAIYLPIPTGLRKEWAIRAAAAGKHVLAEKPVGGTSADAEEIIEACRKHNVQFMDGVMFMHSRRLDRIRSVLDDGASVGQIKRITSQFSFCAPDDFLQSNIRVNSDLEPLGCLGDLGWYNIRFTLWVMKEKLPQSVSGRLLSEIHHPQSPAAVPTEFSGEMLFADGVSASFYCSFLTENQEWANISGSKGHLQVPDFVLPYYGAELRFNVANAVFNVRGCAFRMEEHTRTFAVPEYSDSEVHAQETNLFRDFSRLVLAGHVDQHWSQIALNTQKVLDACLQSARNGSQPVALAD